MATHGWALPMLGGSLPFLSAKAGNEGKPAATRSPPGPLGAPAAAAGSNQLQVEASGDGGSPSRSPVQCQDVAVALAPWL
jgi:hypothetical protein